MTGSSIPTPLKLTIKTSEQQLLCCPCAFIVDFEQILSIGFYAYLTYFTNTCFHCFEQVITMGKVLKTEKNRWRNKLLKCLSKKRFGIKNVLKITETIEE